MSSMKIDPSPKTPSLPESVTGFRPDNPLRAWLIFSLVTLICISIFAVHLCGPPDLMDNDQERPASYVMDIISRGNWIVQRDQSGRIMSKPPVSTWLTALIALPFKNINLFLLYLPCALATLAIAWLILGSGSVHFGVRAAFLGSCAYLLSMISYKQVALARTDSLFAFTVFSAGLLAWRAWNRGSGWTCFWLMAAAATLTKGPLAVILALGGLWAVVWEKRSGSSQHLRGSQVPGIVLFLLITLGWLMLAYGKVGSALTDKMIWQELFGHAVKSDKGKLPLLDFYIPFLYFLSRFAPWSILACIGFWRIWKRPAHSAIERRFERFLFCYFFFGLLIFSLAPHQRPDHLWPLIPAAALIAGRELAYLFRCTQNVRLMMYVLLLLIFSLSLAALHNTYFRSRDKSVMATSRVRQFARDIQKKVGGSLPLIFVDTPYALQFYLNTMTQQVSLQQAAKALSSDYPAFIVIKDHLKALLDGNKSRYYTLASGPQSAHDLLFVVSNHPVLEPTPRVTAFSSPFMMKMEGVRLVKSSLDRVAFAACQPNGFISLTNESDRSRRLRVEIDNIRPALTEDVVLDAGQSWSYALQNQRIAADSGWNRYILAVIIFTPLLLVLFAGGFSTLQAMKISQPMG
ncbi:MAG: glycosyltransferase family 39 protein [bacterium]